MARPEDLENLVRWQDRQINRLANRLIQHASCAARIAELEDMVRRQNDTIERLRRRRTA